MGSERLSRVLAPADGTRSSAAPVIERAPLATVEVEGAAHIVSYANSAFCSLVGKTRDELLGTSFANIVPGGGECMPILDSVYNTGKAVTHAREDSSENGTARWLYAMWPTLDPSHRPVGVIIQMVKAASSRQETAAINEALLIAGLYQHELTEKAENLNAQLQREITERKLAEAALVAAVDDLKRVQKAKDEFLANLSHELRTPLTPVLMAATALSQDGRLPPDAREQLGMMERNITLEARLIDDLLDLTKIAYGKLQLQPQLCDVNALIGFAVEIVREEARAKQVSMDCILNARYSALTGDPGRLQQVIWNLLRNAVKFSLPGGRMAISSGDQENQDGERWIRIEVADSGVGMDADIARSGQIFQPFDQGGLPGGNHFGGVGLGLAIARAVVDLHGGRINAFSAGPNCGATFTVELPGAVEPSAAIKITSPPAETKASEPDPMSRKSVPTAGSLRLLLVEDNEDTLKVLLLLLEHDGHRVVSAASVADALSAAAANEFELVISDIGLPDGTGIELMTKLRAEYGLRGIALSGYGTEKDVERSRKAGFVAHLVKPVPNAELRRALAAISPLAQSLRRESEPEKAKEITFQRASVLRERAHDLRGQLSIIASATDFIADSTVGEAMRAKSCGILERAVRAASAMLAGIVDEVQLDDDQEHRG
jgi:signal transduction histidine kinase